MDRKMFGHSRMLLVYDDGSELGTCSLHCVAVDMALNIDKMPKTIQVADYNTKNLIDAEKAVWVIGGEKPGVMSKRAKWAFEKKADAEVYIQANKGALADFEATIKASYEDMYADTQMIRERRKAKRMKQGS
jgi:nitrous oxide reductase accessory protein NosL